VFGPNGDIKPLALTVVKDHCAVTITPGSTATTADTAAAPEAADAATDATDTETAAAPLQLQLEGGKGAVYHNGRALAEGEKVTLGTYDRVALGTCPLFIKGVLVVVSDMLMLVMKEFCTHCTVVCSWFDVTRCILCSLTR
jgi:hypothetical protein